MIEGGGRARNNKWEAFPSKRAVVFHIAHIFDIFLTATLRLKAALEDIMSLRAVSSLKAAIGGMTPRGPLQRLKRVGSS